MNSPLLSLPQPTTGRIQKLSYFSHRSYSTYTRGYYNKTSLKNTAVLSGQCLCPELYNITQRTPGHLISPAASFQSGNTRTAASLPQQARLSVATRLLEPSSGHASDQSISHLTVRRRLLGVTLITG